ncbi:hypothetical protein ACSFA7_19330 [Variovorax sp. LT1R20]|uniref:hypothetical protein n=1 Tax=Variovorax sp. LT1R20 TaxID=3443729 RepID=UPI003F474D51
MFDFFKKKKPPAPAATVETGPAVPTPLAERKGHVGAIEAVTLDGTMYFFGFDFSSDLVLSPLIADIDIAARFASQHMTQRDGTHDEAYWRELAGYAVEGSELATKEESRTFSTEALAAAIASLARVRREGTVEPGFAIEYHLRYLLGAAGGWEVPEEAGTEDADEWIDVISGNEPLAEGTTLTDIAGRLQAHLNALVDTAPGNWSTKFAVLKG